MDVITAMSSKGGVGKTTTLMALASAAVARGQRVLMCDTDQNMPLTRWGNSAVSNENWSDQITVEPFLDFDSLHAAILAHEERGDVDLVLVDPRGGRTEFHNALAQIVDFIIVPSRPVKVDADEVITTFAWLKKLEGAGAEVAPSRLVYAAIKTASQMSADMVMIRDALVGVPQLTAQLPERVGFQNMQTRGLLGEIIKAMSASPDPMVRGQARTYRNVLTEAEALLKEIDAIIGAPVLAEA